MSYREEGNSVILTMSREDLIRPDADSGATCPCGHGFSFKVWLLDYWECPRCGRRFSVLNSGNPNYTPYVEKP